MLAITLSLTPHEWAQLADLAALCGLSVEDYTTGLVRRHLPWVVVRVPATGVITPQVSGAAGRSGTLTIYEV